MNAFQNIVKLQFSHIGTAEYFVSEINLPCNMTRCKWYCKYCMLIVVTGYVFEFNKVKSSYNYDSVYSLASNDTLHIIAQLVQSKEKSLRIQLMNVAKQSGSVDCGLYALAMLTCLLLNTDPTTIVFESDEMRPHLVQILQCGKVSMFPIRKHRQPTDKVLRNQEIQIYCYCRLPDWAHYQLPRD